MSVLSTTQETSCTPLVSIVTPVYNGDGFLAQCIDSVLTQSYENWEYIIVNNCSTDRTLAIVQRYAEKDSRIRLYSNKKLLPIMENWNHAMRKISSASKYCKVVHADDWIFPQCIELMVSVAEANPSVGIVGSYSLKGEKIVSDNLPFPSQCIPGRDLCRRALLNQVWPFPRPTALLIRSGLIRNKDPFYTEANMHADHEVCYEILRDHDFGFVYQVLTFLRLHNESVTSADYAAYGKLHYTNLALLMEFGPVFLGKDEYQQTLKKRIELYHKFLAFSLFEKRDKGFWKYHKNSLHELSYPLAMSKLYCIICIELTRHPRNTFSKIKKCILGQPPRVIR